MYMKVDGKFGNNLIWLETIDFRVLPVILTHKNLNLTLRIYIWFSFLNNEKAMPCKSQLD